MSDEPRWAWIAPPSDQVIDRDHPDYEYWQETYALEEMPAAEPPTPKLPEQPQRPEVPAVALAVGPDLAAEFLSVSRDFFDAKVKPDLRVVTKGRRILVPVRELERWLDENAAFALRGR